LILRCGVRRSEIAVHRARSPIAALALVFDAARMQGTAVISCNSILEKQPEILADGLPTDVPWPSIIRGIRAYSNRQPPSIAADLFELADMLCDLAELRSNEPVG
jgi:hypothetical protein